MEERNLQRAHYKICCGYCCIFQPAFGCGHSKPWWKSPFSMLFVRLRNILQYFDANKAEYSSHGLLHKVLAGTEPLNEDG